MPGILVSLVIVAGEHCLSSNFAISFVGAGPRHERLSRWLAEMGVMHEGDDAYSIQSTRSRYWLDQFLTLALNTWISSKFSTFHWICLFILLICVELPLCTVVTLSQNAITCFLELT